tara:strand:+ start:8304 stop:8975 length:672 start_codon:yes stop_codon:yes gene_type:complete
MSLKNIFFVTILFLFTQESISQRNFDESNFLGITGGYTMFDIMTSDFNTKQAGGFIGGFSTRGAFRNDFDLIFGLNYFSNNVEIFGTAPVPLPTTSDTQYIDYNLQGVQLYFLGSYNIIKNHLSLEFGPVLNISGKLKLKSETFEDYILDGYNSLKAKDIQDVSPVNFHLHGGITGGAKNFRLSVQYQYGVTNMLGKLNKNDLEYDNFKGNSSLIVLAGIFYF